jgi:hypothetical protein
LRTRLSVPRRLHQSSSMTVLLHDQPEGACPFVTLPNDLNNRLDLTHTAQNTFPHTLCSPLSHHHLRALAAHNGIAHYWRSRSGRWYTSAVRSDQCWTPRGTEPLCTARSASHSLCSVVASFLTTGRIHTAHREFIDSRAGASTQAVSCLHRHSSCNTKCRNHRSSPLQVASSVAPSCAHLDRTR